MNLLVNLIAVLVCGIYLFHTTSAMVIEQLNDEERVSNIHDAGETVFDKILKQNKRSNDEARENNEPGLFEGDIQHVEEPEGNNENQPGSRNMTKRSHTRHAQQYLWVTRVLPYVISPQLESNTDVIVTAMKEIESKTCIKFRKHTNEKQWVVFEHGNACSSGVGREFWSEGSQRITLGDNCMYVGIVQHEILHALGVWHEQSRPDRDNYIEILWENIYEGDQYNFKKQDSGELDQTSNYDLDSIMHYGSHAFSKNGADTIKAVNHPDNLLGQRKSLSTEDIIKLNELYRCQDIGNILTEWSSWTTCTSDCQKQRQRFCSSEDLTKCPGVSVYGVHTDYTTCSHEECYRPIDGHWNKWSSWSECGGECDNGKRHRTRTCDDPEPKNGGKACVGSNRDEGVCSLPCGFGPDDCSFDSGNLCDVWEVELKTAGYQWHLNSGKTPSGNTGPDYDHTTMDGDQSGHYLYAESSSPAQNGNKAGLLSKAFAKTANQRCLTFFYSMHGSSIRALRVFIVDQETGTVRNLWERKGPQGEGWNEGEIDFSSDHEYKIRFESERGDSFQGDIALDDIQFRDNACNQQVPEKIPEKIPEVESENIFQVCNAKVERLGCFNEDDKSRSIEVALDSHRSGYNTYHGEVIDWNNYPVSMTRLMCHCIERAKARGLKYIGLSYYALCYGTNSPSYDKYGTSSNCIDSSYQSCSHPKKEDVCIGTIERENYVYRII